MELLAAQVRELQERLNRNSANASRPPSSDPPWTARPNRGKPGARKRGAQKGHAGQQRAWVPAAELTARHEYWPETCGHCQAAFPADTPLETEGWAHQVYELPMIRPEVVEHVRRARCCFGCGRRT